MDDLIGQRRVEVLGEPDALVTTECARPLGCDRYEPSDGFACIGDDDLFSGAQGYTGLRRRLWRNLIPSLVEIGREGRLFSS
mgnify:CR=1 FL=1